MKKILMLVAVLLLLSAQSIKAQSHYTVWHDAKAVTFIEDCEEVHDVQVILNNDSDSEVELTVKYRNDEWKMCFPVEKVSETEADKTTWRFKDKSAMTMFHTDNGDICKFTIKTNDGDPYDKIVFLFYM